MTQRELITHFINRLRLGWKSAVSSAARYCIPSLGTEPTSVSTTHTHTHSQLAHTHIHAQTRRRTNTHLSLSLSLCCRLISQTGEYLNVIMTFAIKSKQRSQIGERGPQTRRGGGASPPVSHKESVGGRRVLFDCSFYFYSFFFFFNEIYIA